MVYYLSIQSFTFVGVGIHYYGKIVTSKQNAYVRKSGVELKKVMDSVDAIKLNARDGMESSWGYKEGEETHRFDSEAEVLTAAFEWFKKNGKARDYLIRGSAGSLTVQKVLAGPKKWMDISNGFYDRFEAIGGYEGNEKEATKIDDEWMEHVLPHIDPEWKKQ